LNNNEIKLYEQELTYYTLEELMKLKKIIIYTKKNVNNILLFNLIGFHAHDVAEYLNKNNILIRAGNFCCPYLKKVIGIESAVRISLAFYNIKEEIDKLIFYLKKLIFNPKLIISYLL